MAVVEIGDPRSVLWEIRRLVPSRGLEPWEDLRIAEHQARRLLQLLGIVRPPVSLAEITALLDIRVTIDHGSTVVIPSEPEWEAGGWHITVAHVSSRRIHAIVAHQLKHVLDDQFGSLLYPPTELLTTADRRDRAAAHFAGSLLMPRDWVKESWCRGDHMIPTLARRFGSPEAMVRTRLATLGLSCPDEQSGVVCRAAACQVK